MGDSPDSKDGDLKPLKGLVKKRTSAIDIKDVFSLRQVSG